MADAASTGDVAAAADSMSTTRVSTPVSRSDSESTPVNLV